MAASICIEAVAALSGLDVDRLSLRRGGRVLFRDLRFRLKVGDVLAIEGPNGAGKTSLLRALAGFLDPVSGTIRFTFENGADVEDAAERGVHIGWLGYLDAVKPQMTPREHIDFFVRYMRGSGDTQSVLARCGLSRLADIPSQYLSGGQKRRLSLARLIAVRRFVWLLDEPFAALDAEGKLLVCSLVSEHCAAGGIAVAATHDPLEIPCGRLMLDASQ